MGVAARAGRPLLRDPQRPRHGRLGPGDRRGPGGAVLARGDLAGKAACRADLLARSGSTRPTTGRCRDDRAARPAEGLRPARRRRARRCSRAGRAVIVQGSGHAVARGAVPRARRRRARAASRSSSGSIATMARRIYAGADLLPDAVALRAVRPGPDDRAPLRDAADRPPDGRPRRHRHRRSDAARGGDRLRVRRGDRRPRWSRPAIAAVRAMRRRPARRGTALLDAGHGGRLRLGDRLGARATSTPTGARSRCAGRSRGSRRRTPGFAQVARSHRG